MLLFTQNMGLSQDTSIMVTLDEVKISGNRPVPERLKEIEENYLFAGKKNEVIRLNGINANLISNNTRQIFARVPGITIWENDGSGIQISVGARGLNPNRSWEFNTRQNGYDISSDVFGYPEAYYNPPMEAVEKIQIVRGAASLQFGPQFGGLLNYILKREREEKPFVFETQQGIGSYGMFSSYIAISGNTKKWNYNVYNHSRAGNGWRENGHFNVRNSHAFVQYKIRPKTSISAEFTNMDYVIQQSGGLTDVQFHDNPKQSLRRRNWFGAPWNLVNINFDIKPSEKLSLNLKIFGLFGERNSIGYTLKPNIQDTVNTITNDYNNRQVDIDSYNNVGAEFRGIRTYKWLGNEHNLAFGARVYQANTNRKQKGKGDTDFDFNTIILTEKFPSDYEYQTKNTAVFAENIFHISNAFSVTPGLRYENIKSSIEGRASIVSGNEINVNPQTITRDIVLSGVGVEFKINSTNIYGNFSQAYRPVLFSDITPPSTTDVVDPNLKDANGFNADIGYRGSLGDFLNFDVTGFYIQYNNRIGVLLMHLENDPSKSTYLFRTNLGKSVNTGIEAYFECNAFKLFTQNNHVGTLNVFASLAFIKAEYIDFKTTKISGSVPNVIITEGNLKGNKVEYAPSQIHNFGVTYHIRNFSATIQTRIVSAVYSDASNTETHSADGLTGKIQGYTVYDLSAEYKFLKKYNIKTGINNLSDVKYVTRRAGGYPGPGLLPGDGKTMYLSIGAKF